jgi:hypothetical protein
MAVRASLCHLQHVLSSTSAVYALRRLRANIALVSPWRFDMPLHGKPKNVFVRAYTRIRFGELESVCQHWRSHPHQMLLF